MRWVLIAVLSVLTPVLAVNSGTFVDDFSDRNLDEWHIGGNPKPFIPDRVSVRAGHAVMNAAPEGFPLHRAIAYMELRTGDWENWDSYSLTCRIRFEEIREEKTGEFDVRVRRGKGRFGVAAWQHMRIYPGRQRIQVITVPPDAKADPAGITKIRRETLDDRHLRRPIELNQWIPIEVVAEKDRFEFHFDGNLVTRYEDETAVPGTVGFVTYGGLVVHLDDVIISGAGVPQSVDHDEHLATTWGEIKDSRRR